MQSTIIKTTIKELSHEPTSIQKFVIAFCEMDLASLESLISDNYESREIDNKSDNKYDFMAELKTDFEKLKAKGDTHFTAKFGHCSFCDRNFTGYKFISDKTGEWYSFVLKENSEGTIDVKVCDNILPLDVLESLDNEDFPNLDFA